MDLHMQRVMLRFASCDGPCDCYAAAAAAAEVVVVVGLEHVANSKREFVVESKFVAEFVAAQGGTRSSEEPQIAAKALERRALL